MRVDRADSIGHDAMKAENESPGAGKQGCMVASACKGTCKRSTGSTWRNESRKVYLSREAERLRRCMSPNEAAAARIPKTAVGFSGESTHPL